MNTVYIDISQQVDFIFRKGNDGSIKIRVYDTLGAAFDLTGYTPSYKVYSGGTLILTNTPVISSTNLITVTFPETDMATAGEFFYELLMTVGTVTKSWLVGSHVVMDSYPYINDSGNGLSVTVDTTTPELTISMMYDADAYTKAQTDALLLQKQNVLVSGTNIKTINSNSLLGSGDISVATLLGLTPISLTSLSSTATGLTYTNTTGVFSLTSGYVIPTTTQETNWGTAYSHVSLTNNPHSVTASQVGLGNVTNESKATMFTNSTFTGNTIANNLALGGQAISTHALSVNGTVYFDDYIGIGIAPNSFSGLYIANTNLTGVSQYGGYIAPTTTTAATSYSVGFGVQNNTATGTYTQAVNAGIRIASTIKGSGSTITTAYGLLIEDINVGATNYGIFQAGSALNSFGGHTSAPSLAIGGATIGTNALAVTGSAIISGNTGIGTTSPLGNLHISSATALTANWFSNSAEGVDEKNWAWQMGSGITSKVLRLRAINDANSAGVNAIEITRSGYTIEKIVMANSPLFVKYSSDPTSGNSFAVNGASYFSGNATFAGSVTANSGFSVPTGYGLSANIYYSGGWKYNTNGSGYALYNGGTTVTRLSVFANNTGGVGASGTEIIALSLDNSNGNATFAGSVSVGGTTGLSVKNNTGVDGTFQDIIKGVYYDVEVNSIQTSVASAAVNSGFKFMISNGGGSSAQTVGYKMVRNDHTFYIEGVNKFNINSSGNATFAGSITSTSLALGGATIGTNALAVTGTTYVLSSGKAISKIGTTEDAGQGINFGYDATLNWFAYNFEPSTAASSRFAFVDNDASTVPTLFISTATDFVGVKYAADPTSGNSFAVNGASYFNGTITGTGKANFGGQSFIISNSFLQTTGTQDPRLTIKATDASTAGIFIVPNNNANLGWTIKASASATPTLDFFSENPITALSLSYTGAATFAGSVSVNGATIGTNALAVTGSAIISNTVGIGTISPNASLANLHLYQSGTGDGLLISSNGPRIRLDELNSTDQNWMIYHNAGNLYIGTDNDIFNSFSEKLTILNGGFVGVGYTSDPTSGNKFAVNGASYFGGAIASSGAIYSTSSSIQAGTLFTTYGSNDLIVQARTGYGVTLRVNGTTDALTLASTGNATFAGSVGIGASPLAKLHLEGAGTQAIRITNTTAGSIATPQLTQINFNGYNNETRARIEATDIASSTNGSEIRFYTANASNVLTQQLVIDKAGAATFAGSVTANGDIKTTYAATVIRTIVENTQAGGKANIGLWVNGANNDIDLSNDGSGNFNILKNDGNTIFTMSQLGVSTFAGSILASAGSAASPSYSFSGDTDTGIYSAGANQIDITTAGVRRFILSVSGLYITSGIPLTWNEDLYLHRDAANTLALRNSTNAQTFNVYNTYTDASNYEKLSFAWVGNSLYFGTSNLGTGTGRTIYFMTGGTARWGLPLTGHFTPEVNNTYDLGTSANKIRTGYFGTSVVSAAFTLSALQTPPASASATGTTGEIRYGTDGYVYLCTATDTWVRTQLTTWS